jgi:hypothetical protein
MLTIQPRRSVPHARERFEYGSKNCVRFRVLTATTINRTVWNIEVYSGRILPMFRPNVLPPSSGSKSKSTKEYESTEHYSGGITSSTLMMETVSSSETLLNIYQAIRWHTPDQQYPYSLLHSTVSLPPAGVHGGPPLF